MRPKYRGQQSCGACTCTRSCLELLAQRVGRVVDEEIPVQLHVAVGTVRVRVIVCLYCCVWYDNIRAKLRALLIDVYAEGRVECAPHMLS